MFLIDNQKKRGNFMYIFILILFVLLSFFSVEKASPNKAIVISGIRRKPRILIGKSGIKMPFFERKDVLTLEPITIDLKMNNYYPTEDSIKIKINAVVKTQVCTHAEALQLAIKNLLNKTEEDIHAEIEGIINDILRKTIATHKLQTICDNVDSFCKNFQTNLENEISKYGLTVMSCYIKDIRDIDGRL